MNTYQANAAMENFIEAHPDVPFAQYNERTGVFSMIRIVQGDEAAGNGTSMQEAYDVALMNWVLMA